MTITDLTREARADPVAITDTDRPSPGPTRSRPAPQSAVPGRDARWPKAWLGVVAIAAGVTWLGVIGWQTLWQQGDLSAALARTRGLTVGPGLLVVVVALIVAERLSPAVKRPLLARAHLVDAAYLALFAVAVVPALTLVDTGLSVEVGRHARFLLVGRLPIVPQVAVVVAILVAMDGLHWLAHVANHRSAALWRLHALHHSQEDMSVLTTFRIHPLVEATYLVALFPALILAASGIVPSVALVVYGCLVTLPHANLRWKLGPLGYVFVSPAYHRLHHTRTPIDWRGTVNFGFVLVCWDQLAHRAVFPSGGEPIATGIAGRPVPVEQASSAAGTPRVVLAQLWQPFSMRAATDGRR